MFLAVISVVEEAQARALQPLRERRKVVEKEAAELKNELTQEITRFQTTISELKDISTLEDHVLFLQVRGNLGFQQCTNMKFLYNAFFFY